MVNVKFKDISAQVYGKYQHCTQDNKSGLWFADVDMIYGHPKKGALPSPRQDTPELRALSQAMHQKDANQKAQELMDKINPPSLVTRVLRFLNMYLTKFKIRK